MKKWHAAVANMQRIVLILCVLAAPRVALAQQRNLAFAFDGGWDIISAAPVPADALDTPDTAKIPLRLRAGWRLGVEGNYKLQHDKWRVYGRGSVHFLKFPQGASGGTFDHRANNNIGTVLGIEWEAGGRYYFLTDKIRPFAQVGVSYLYLRHFSGPVEDERRYLPHPNVLSLHVQPGVEFSVRRDVAVRVGIDVQRWLVFRADDDTMFTLSAGVIFYS